MKSSSSAFGSADAETLAEWSALVASCGANPTLSPAWLEASIAALGTPDTRVSISVLRDSSGTMRAVVPHFTRRIRMLGLPMWQLELASNLMSYHAGLVAPGIEAEALDDLLHHNAGWDVLRVCNIATGSATDAALHAYCRHSGGTMLTLRGETSPYLRIDAGWEQYLATRNKKFRYKLRKRQETLSPPSPYVLTWYSREADVERLLAEMLAIEGASWKAGEGTDIGSRGLEAQYHRVLLPRLARQGWLRALVLYKDGQPIAYSLCCHAGDWFGHLKTSFDANHAEVSPGGIVIDASVEQAFAAGAREFDFLGDATQHKLAWTDSVRAHVDYLIFARRPKARLVGAIKAIRQARAMPRAA
jgi:CelD/BcsL family acetyltransferase involved in cellulose biosynthesis